MIEFHPTYATVVPFEAADAGLYRLCWSNNNEAPKTHWSYDRTFLIFFQ